jgi:hypothetical protein
VPPFFVLLWVATFGSVTVASGPFFGAEVMDFTTPAFVSQRGQFLSQFLIILDFSRNLEPLPLSADNYFKGVLGND